MNDVFITPDVERLMQGYDTLQDPPTVQTADDIKLSLKNASPTAILQMEGNKMSLPELTTEKVIKLQKVMCSARMYCST